MPGRGPAERVGEKNGIRQKKIARKQRESRYCHKGKAPRIKLALAAIRSI